MCEGPPFMNKKMIRFARAGKWGFFTASGDAPASLDAADAAACSWSMAFKASEPKPQAEVRRKFRREVLGEGFMACSGS